MKRTFALFLFSIIITQFSVSQTIPDPLVPQGSNLEVPEGWEIRLDRPDDSVIVGANPDSSDIFFVNMTPGWHITTGPRAIFYHPESELDGDYSIHSDIHLFDTKGRDREAFGLFFGGNALQDTDQEYVYFLIRNTGDYLIKRRIGDSTELIKDWMASEAIVIYDDPEISSVLNSLAVSVEGSNMNFFINGTQVAQINADEFNVTTDGIFGLRVNHAINLHVEDLGIGIE
jgi:hypothetical protein